MTKSKQLKRVGPYSLGDVGDCEFADPQVIEALAHRTSPYCIGSRNAVTLEYTSLTTESAIGQLAF